MTAFCIISVNPKYIYKHNLRTIRTSHKFNISRNDLVIKDVRFTDQKSYECVLSLDLSKDMESCWDHLREEDKKLK